MWRVIKLIEEARVKMSKCFNCLTASSLTRVKHESNFRQYGRPMFSGELVYSHSHTLSLPGELSQFFLYLPPPRSTDHLPYLKRLHDNAIINFLDIT